MGFLHVAMVNLIPHVRDLPAEEDFVNVIACIFISTFYLGVTRATKMTSFSL